MSKVVQIFFYAGAIQGILLLFGLFSIRTNKSSNRILGILSGIWGVILLVFALKQEGLFLRFPHFLFVFDQLFFLIFPLLYLYAKYLLSSQTKYQRKDLWHFVPFALSVLAHTGFFLESGEDKLFLRQNPTDYIKILQFVSDEIVGLQSIVYSVLTIKLIYRYQLKIVDHVSNIHKSRINLLQVGVSIILIAWIIGVIGLNLHYLGVELGFDYFFFSYLALVFVIYFISYSSLRSPEIFKVDARSLLEFRSLHPGQLIGINAVPARPGVISSEDEIPQSIAKNDPRFQSLNNRLLDYMEQKKPYLNPELNLIKLASDLNVSRNELSELINTIHKKNFYEFVNEYRVEEVKRLMKESDHGNDKMLTLGFEAGFNSKASFYRVFKQFLKMTPKEYFDSFKM